MILKFRVYEQTISLQATKSEPRQGSRDYLELQFSFSPDWNDLLKYVYIQHGEVSVPHDLVEGSVIVDEYFTEQTEFNVTLFGKSADGSIEVPTNVITVFLKESNNLWVKDAPEPQNSWFVQVADARDEALASAVRAENAAIHQPYPNEETGTWWVWSAETGKYEDTGESYGAGGGTSDHTELSNRDAADQHPMSAITGLEDALDSKQPKGNYLTKELDPTVSEWAKQPQKPTYTAQEVGAIPATTQIPSTADDVNAEPSGAVNAHNTNTESHADLRAELAALADRINAVLDSDDETLDELSEIVAYIKSNKTLIDAITTSKVSVTDIIDNLTTNVSNKPLSAAQGVALKALIDALTTAVSGKAPTSHGNHVPTTETADNARFLRNDNTWQTITPAGIGAAAAADIATTKMQAMSNSTVAYVKISDFGAWGTGAWYQKGFSMLITSRGGEMIWLAVSSDDSNTNAKAIRLLNTYSKIAGVYYSASESAVYVKVNAWCNNINAHILSNVNGDYVPTVATASALASDAVEVKIAEFGQAYDHVAVGRSDQPVKLRGSAARPLYNDAELALKSDIPALKTETWTFTLEDGSTVTKAVHVG